MVCHVNVSSGSDQGADYGQVAENIIIIITIIIIMILSLLLSPCVKPRPDDVANTSDRGGARVRDGVHIRAVAQQNPAAGPTHQPVVLSKC